MGAHPFHDAIPRVLYVDDDPVSRRIFEQLGKSAQVVVDSCGSLDEAVGLCRVRRYAVIAADYALRRFDGLSVLRELSALSPHASLMLVTDGERKRELPSSLLNYVFVEKPVRRAHVIGQLRDAVRASEERITRPHLSLFSAPLLLLAPDAHLAATFERTIREHAAGRLRLTSTSDLSQAIMLLKSLRFSAMLVHADLGATELTEALSALGPYASEVPLVVFDAEPQALSDELRYDLSRRGISILRRGADAELVTQILGSAVERAERERRIEQLSATDTTSGALNRAAFYELLERRVATREPFLLTGIRIAGLAKINEDLGQLRGDAVLAGTARRLSFEFGSQLTLGRIGGALFAAFFSTLPVEEPERVGQRVRQALDVPFDLDDAEVAVEVCTRTFEVDEGCRSASELLQNVERMLRADGLAAAADVRHRSSARVRFRG